MSDRRCSDSGSVAVPEVPRVGRDGPVGIRTGGGIESNHLVRSRVCRSKRERGRWELICQEVQDLSVARLDVEDNIPERVPGRTSGAQVVLNP